MISEQTMSFLRYFFHEQVDLHSALHTSNAHTQEPIWQYEDHRFPNAKGQLGKRLRYAKAFSAYRSGEISHHKLEEMRARHRRDIGTNYIADAWSGCKAIPKDEEAHNITKLILERIEKQK